MASTATLVRAPALPQPLSTDSLQSIADELACAVAGVELKIPIGAQRGFVRLTITHSYEAWLIAWNLGSALRMHDHGGSAGAIAVVSGTLAEAYFDRGRPGSMRRRRLHGGAIVDVPPNRVHEIRNPGPGRSLSVHAYSPPLAAMTFYDAARE